MRGKLSILFALPVANALSLANFQSITSILIPINCQLAYDGQISGCQVSDFNTGCTPACVAGLNAIAKSVISACDSVSVTASSLLGIIQAGHIQEALCPTLAKSTTSTTKAKTTATQTSLSVDSLSVTIPTDSAGVTGGLGFVSSTTAAPAKTTSSTATQLKSSATLNPTTKSVPSTSTTASTTASTAAASSTSSPQSSESGIAPASSTTSDKSSIATSSSNSKTTANTQPNTGGTGGGSPFDISSSASRLGRDWIWSFIIFATCAGVLLGR